MTETLDPEFEAELQANPTRRIDVIVRTGTDPRDLMSGVMAHGLSIRHTYSLMKALAVSGPATSILALADEPWVVRIEPDREVRTMH